MTCVRLAGQLRWYLVSRWLLHFGLFLSGFLVLVFLVEVLELLRRSAGKPEATLAIALHMGWLKLPDVGLRITVLIVLYSSMFTFWSMGRSRELLIIQGLGISVWQLLIPLLIWASAVGILLATLIQPLGSAMLREYASMERRYIRLDSGHRDLWLRQPDKGGGYFLLYAAGVEPHAMRLSDVVALRLGESGSYESRFDASQAVWQAGYWELRQGAKRGLEQAAGEFVTHRIPVTFDPGELDDLLDPPQYVSFWRLPVLARVLETAGLGSAGHRLRYHLLLARPLLLSSMVLLAAVCSLPSKITRGSFGAQCVGVGIALGFMLFVLTDVVGTLGEAGLIPIVAAAWAPGLIGVLGGVTALLCLEDG